MKVRGGLHPPIRPVTTKPQSEQAKELLEKAVGGVLKPGQHLVLPAKTGLAHFSDHFDARTQPDYDKLLKGETAQSSSAKAAEEAPADAHADAAATAFAQESALALMDLLPQIPVPPPLALARKPLTDEELEDEDEAQERRQEHGEPESGDGGEDADFVGLAPAMEPRTLELQAGTFTLDEGSIDVRERRLCTLEAFLDGDVAFVSCAVDMNAIPDGAELRIPALDAAAGRPVRLRAVHQTARTEGVGGAYLEVCVSDPDAWRSVLDTIVAVQVG